MKSGNLKFLEPSRPLQACNGTAFLHNWYVSRNIVSVQLRDREGCAQVYDIQADAKVT